MEDKEKVVADDERQARVQTDGVDFWVEVRTRKLFGGYRWSRPGFLVNTNYSTSWGAQQEAERYLRRHGDETVVVLKVGDKR